MISKRELSEELDIKEKMVNTLETRETLFDEYTEKPYHNIVKDILEFIAKPAEWKKKQADEWDNYYEMVKTTNAYERYQMQRKAFKKGDIGLVKKIAEVSRRALAEGRQQIPLPRELDIESLKQDYHYLQYLNLKKRVVSLKKQLGETSAYESAKEVFK